MAQEKDFRNRLLQLLQGRYKLEELQDLYFILQSEIPGLSYDNVSGDTLRAKARGLIEFAEQRGALPALLRGIKRHRKDLASDIERLGEPPKLSSHTGESQVPEPSTEGGRGQTPIPITAAKIRAAATIVAALIGLLAALIGLKQCNNDQASRFSYQVQVLDSATDQAIEGAHVTIMVGGNIAPIDDYTNSRGFVILSIDASRAGKLGRVNVKASGYKDYSDDINLNRDALPSTIKLEPLP